MPEKMNNMSLPEILTNRHLLTNKLISNLKHGYYEYDQQLKDPKASHIASKEKACLSIVDTNHKLRQQWISALNIDNTDLEKNTKYQQYQELEFTWIQNTLTAVNPIIIDHEVLATQKLMKNIGLNTNIQKVANEYLKAYLISCYQMERILANSSNIK